MISCSQIRLVCAKQKNIQGLSSGGRANEQSRGKLVCCIDEHPFDRRKQVIFHLFTRSRFAFRYVGGAVCSY